MKILHFIRCFVNDCGAYFYLSKLKKGLEAYGVRQYYLAYEKTGEYYENSELDNIPVMNEIDVESYFNDIDPDIVHFHDNYAYYIRNGKQDHNDFYNLCNDKVRVRTIHDYSQAICPNYLSENHGECDGVLAPDCLKKTCIAENTYLNYKKYIEQIKQYDGIAVFSDKTLEKLAALGFERKRLFKLPPLLEKCGCPNSRKENIIIFAGRLVPQKGVDYLIRAASKMKNSSWKIVIAGRGDIKYAKELMRMAIKLNLSEKIKFTGYLQHDELCRMYQKSKIMAFPSISHETYGFSGGEAISYGIPVVAFNIDGIGEWLKDGYNGFVVPLMDVERMAEAMDILISDGEVYAKMHKNCMEWSEGLSLDKQIEKMYSYYKSLLDIESM